MEKDNIIAKNPTAYHNYEIIDKLEAGIVLYGTEIMGDTPRLAFVFSVNPRAKINNPTKYINKRSVLLFKIIFLSLKN